MPWVLGICRALGADNANNLYLWFGLAARTSTGDHYSAVLGERLVEWGCEGSRDIAWTCLLKDWLDEEHTSSSLHSL